MALLLSAAPAIMIFQPWPIRAALLVSEPALDRLADDLLAEKPTEFPRWAGVFRVVGSRVQNGNVAFIMQPDSAGASGLVRKAPGQKAGPLYNLFLDFKISDRWRYQIQD